MAQYHKSEICLKGLSNLYSMPHPLCLGPRLGQEKLPPKTPWTGKKGAKSNRGVLLLFAQVESKIKIQHFHRLRCSPPRPAIASAAEKKRWAERSGTVWGNVERLFSLWAKTFLSLPADRHLRDRGNTFEDALLANRYCFFLVFPLRFVQEMRCDLIIEKCTECCGHKWD